MKLYIGTKIIAAEPMGEEKFLFLHGKSPSYNIATQRDGYRVMYEDGYISWSSKETFERAYREINLYEMALVDTYSDLRL